METLSGRQEPGTVSSSLGYVNTSARKRAGRMYHRVITGLKKQGQVRMITLTTARQDDNVLFQKHFRMLRMRLLRKHLLVDYIRCPEFTKGGLRHEHILFRGSYIDQRILSGLWSKIHGAKIVDIRAVRGERGLARYMAGYMVKSPAGRYAYSWGWVWKGYAGSWAALKKFWWQTSWDYKDLLTFWDWCVINNRRPEELVPI